MGNAVCFGHTYQQLEAQLAYTMFAPRLCSGSVAHDTLPPLCGSVDVEPGGSLLVSVHLQPSLVGSNVHVQDAAVKPNVDVIDPD